MKKKIYFQLMTIAVIAISITLLLAGIVCYNLFRSQMLDDLKEYALLIKSTGTINNAEDEAYAHEVLDNLRITLIGEDGTVLFESAAEKDKMDNHKERPEIRQAFLTGEGQAVRHSVTLGKNSFYYALQLEDGSILRVSKEASSILSAFTGAAPALLAILAVLFLFCMGVAHLLTKNLIFPIEQIARSVETLGMTETYEELAPFVDAIRNQHESIIKNAKMRQEFTANVSHELKTPLTSISGYAELIENGMAAEGDVGRFAKEIHRNANRLLTLINDVIRLSELDVVDREETLEIVNLYEITKTCVSMLQINADNHKVKLQFEGTSCEIFSTKQMMEELVYNLCDNAIRYNKENGIVRVDVRPRGEKVFLTVTDSGIGIPKEHQERIFERFYRVDKSRSKLTGGTGLGLAIVKHIVAKHEADMALESESGKGTKIQIVFQRQTGMV